MKKTLLLLISLSLGFIVFAQQRIPKNDVCKAIASGKISAIGKEPSNETIPFIPQSERSVVVNRYDNVEDSETMWTTYDLQSNQFVANRMYQLSNGSVATVATMSHQYNQTASDRGTGYNYYNGSYWQNQPNARIENFKTGWPTIAQWGSSGEILISHGNGGLQCFTRTVAGQGSWVFKSTLPLYPSGYPYQGASDAYPAWARVVTSGNSHNIIHVVAAIQHSISSDETDIRTVLFRSEDAVNWTISYGPLQSYGYHVGEFTADQYALAANGHNVAILYSGSLHNSVWMFKSTNDGLSWNGRRVWQDPYEGQSLNNVIYSDTLYRPMNGSIVIDNNGVVHVALNTFEMARLEGQEPGYYTSWFGRAVDGILYWNDTQNTPIQSEDGNPHHAARLWWPIPEDPGYVSMHPDSTKWIGFIPMYEGYEWNNDNFYHENDYHTKFYGASGHPALSCDPYGNLACAYSAPCVKRLDDNGTYYYRSIYVSYRNVNNGYWEQVIDDLTDEDINYLFLYSDNLYTTSVPNTNTPGEFWFGFQSDDQIGLYWGSNANQANASENTIHAVKVVYNPGSTTTYNISVSANPSYGGMVSGGGTYPQGSTVTLHAWPNEGYAFVNWTKNGTQVSTNPEYPITVTGNASYVAHFQQSTTYYTVSATANPAGSGFVEGQGTYPLGSTCTLSATPNGNYSFEKWVKDGTQVSTSPTYSFTVTSDAYCTAYFVPTYTITATANPTTGGSVTGGGTYAQESTCTLRATPNDGYSFVNWTKNGVQVSTNLDYIFTVTGSETYVANFERNTVEYTITVNADPTEGGTVSGGGTYPEGAICEISAMPNSGYVFERWTRNDVAVSTNPTHIFTVERNATFVAHFTQKANQATITVMADPVEGGAVSGGGTYELGDTCRMNAVASAGYEFVNWTLNGNHVSTEAMFSFTVTSNAVYVAHFNKLVNNYTVSVSLEPSQSAGSVIGAGTYEESASCTLIAIANPTFTFVSWTENGAVVTTDDHYTFTVERDRNLVAVFSQGEFYTITATAGANGTITPEGEIIVEPGVDKTFAIIPNNGSVVSKVLVDGIDVGPVESYTFRSVSANHSILAQFSGLGVDDNTTLDLKVYPNPANDIINIESQNMKRVSIFNLFGVQIESKDVNDDHAVFNTDNLSQGTYILKVESQEGRIDYTRFILIK